MHTCSLQSNLALINLLKSTVFFLGLAMLQDFYSSVSNLHQLVRCFSKILKLAKLQIFCNIENEFFLKQVILDIIIEKLNLTSIIGHHTVPEESFDNVDE